MHESSPSPNNPILFRAAVKLALSKAANGWQPIVPKSFLRPQSSDEIDGLAETRRKQAIRTIGGYITLTSEEDGNRSLTAAIQTYGEGESSAEDALARFAICEHKESIYDQRQYILAPDQRLYSEDLATKTRTPESDTILDEVVEMLQLFEPYSPPHRQM